jgi:carbon starvation protein CstA
MRTKRPVLFALLPMIFMMTISVWALISMTIHNWGKSHIIVVIALVLLVMAISLILLSIKTFLNRIQQKDTP